MKVLSQLYYFIFKFTYYKFVLGKIGLGSKMLSPTLTGCKRIFIGKNVFVRKNCWLAADPATGDPACKLTIGDGTYIGNSCHIYATGSIEIGENVLFSDKVYVSDNMHAYEDINLPVIKQPVKQLSPVVIASGSWLGENVCIIGASVGKNTVVGANSVVTKDIPDYCVAVGAPAKIIKRYDLEQKSWRKTDGAGNFI